CPEPMTGLFLFIQLLQGVCLALLFSPFLSPCEQFILLLRRRSQTKKVSNASRNSRSLVFVDCSIGGASTRSGEICSSILPGKISSLVTRPAIPPDIVLLSSVIPFCQDCRAP